MFKISKFTKKDASRWYKLWAGYQADENLDEETIVKQVSANWPRILNDPNCHTNALRLLDTGEAIGFVNYVVYWFRAGSKDECYLADLFVMPEYQGQGGGRMLINSVIDFAKDNNLQKVQWITQKHNVGAQYLYDQIGEKSEWIKYKVKTS